MLWYGLERFRDVGLLIIRLGFGLGFFWYHGWPKLTGGVERWERTGGALRHFGITTTPEWFGLAAGIAEGIGGLLIAAGLLFRPAAVLIMIVMVVATVQHWVTGMGTPAHSFKNAWLFAGLILVGPGRYSLDYLIARRRAPRTRPAG
jgi:putative oxidoreductase